jgi:hypothetical protein
VLTIYNCQQEVYPNSITIMKGNQSKLKRFLNTEEKFGVCTRATIYSSEMDDQTRFLHLKTRGASSKSSARISC